VEACLNGDEPSCIAIEQGPPTSVQEDCNTDIIQQTCSAPVDVAHCSEEAQAKGECSDSGMMEDLDTGLERSNYYGPEPMYSGAASVPNPGSTYGPGSLYDHEPSVWDAPGTQPQHHPYGPQGEQGPQYHHDVYDSSTLHPVKEEHRPVTETPTPADFTAGCMEVVYSVMHGANGDGDDDCDTQTIHNRLSGVCSQGQLAADVEFCHLFQSSLTAQLHPSDDEWNCKVFDAPLFCDGMYQVSHQFYTGMHNNAPAVQTPVVAPAAGVGPVAPPVMPAQEEAPVDEAAPAAAEGEDEEEAAAPALLQARRKNFLRRGRKVMLNSYP
jgi:hypothetical protein